MKSQEVLELALKSAQEAEVFHVYQKEEPVVFEANRLKRLEGRESSGTALRIIKNGKIGFSSTTNEKDVQALVGNAAGSSMEMCRSTTLPWNLCLWTTWCSWARA
jgi:PmbA protein